jgi:hypothetical protein
MTAIISISNYSQVKTLNEVNGIMADPPRRSFTISPPRKLEIRAGPAIRRPSDPRAFIMPGVARRIHQLAPGYIWDVILASELLNILDPTLSRMVINDWEYSGAVGRPPLEPKGLWSTGPGDPRVIRKDRAMMWAMTFGRPTPPAQVWRLAYWELHRIRFPAEATSAAVAERAHWLIETGLTPLRFRPSLQERRKGPYKPYGDDDDISRTLELSGRRPAR